MDELRLRRAIPGDAPALLAIEALCFATDRIKPRQMRYLLTEARALNLVVEVGAEIVAYCCCLTPALASRPARLYSLAVAPSRQGQGLASVLMRRLLEDIRALGYRRLRLEVRVGDLRTQAIYQQFGFREFTHIDDYYENGEAALRLEAVLQPE